jgi:hypothetical protein
MSKDFARQEKYMWIFSQLRTVLHPETQKNAEYAVFYEKSAFSLTHGDFFDILGTVNRRGVRRKADNLREMPYPPVKQSSGRMYFDLKNYVK